MKKVFVFVLSLCLILSLSITAYAGEIRGLDVEDELRSITNYYDSATKCDNLEEDIINGNLYHGGAKDYEEAKSSIRYDKALKVYIDNNGGFIIFAEGNNNAELKDFIDRLDYSYSVPSEINNKTVDQHLVYGKPVSDEIRARGNEQLIQDIETMEGNWHISSVGVCNTIIDYKGALLETFEEMGIDSADVRLIGSPCNEGHLMAVCFNEDDKPRFIDVYLGYDFETNALTKEATEYTFEEIQEILRLKKENYESHKGRTLGIGTFEAEPETKRNVWIYAVIGVSALAVISVACGIIIKKRSNKKKTQK